MPEVLVRKGEPVSFETRLIGTQNHVRGGIVRINIHRIRPVEGARRGKANVMSFNRSNRDRHI